MTRHSRISYAVIFTFTCFAAALRADQWTTPTPAELAMTSIPEVPNAPAVYLFQEQDTDDHLHEHSHYVRLKVLTERGKEYANVELPFIAGERGYTVEAITGRTIHPDGTIIPFTGKPYEKLIAKAGGYKAKSKVFTLPSVEIGSIIEYRYQVRYEDNIFYSPDWFIQSDIFVRKGHYRWRPTDRDLVNDKGNIVSGQVAWAPILPVGAEVKSVNIHGQLQIDLDVHNIMPKPHEEFMPPMDSLSYRVLFYYTSYRSKDEFWKAEGKNWSKARDHFMNVNQPIKDFAAATVSSSDSEQQKANKLYAAVMTFENTDFTRERSTREEKAEGLKEVSSSSDIVTRKRGNSDQIAETFIALARAAGLKAFAAGVAARDEHFFLPMYFTTRQLDDVIAIVTIDGKDVYYDPGERFCEPGHLAWKHSLAGGIRQIDGGTAMLTTPTEPYKFGSVGRIADLKLDEHGEATGSIEITYSGDPALLWRQQALRGDDTSLKTDLRTHMEELLPGGMEVRVKNVENLADYTKPLKIVYDVKGVVGSSTGKRLLVPADIFEANSKPKFSAPTREISIDMHYSSDSRDAVRYTLPPSIVVEAVPEPSKEMMEKTAAFQVYSRRSTTTVTTFRNLTVASPFFLAAEYPQLKSFYNKLDTKDQETLILTRGAAPSPQASVTVKPAGN